MSVGHEFVRGPEGCDRTVNGRACGLPRHAPTHQSRVVMPKLAEMKAVITYNGSGIPTKFSRDVIKLYRVENGWHPTEIAMGIILGLQIAERRNRDASLVKEES